MKKTFLLSALVGFGVLAAGCGGSGSGIVNDNLALDVDTPVIDITAGDRTEMIAAVNAALARVPGRAVQAYRKLEHGVPVWEVEIVDAARKLWEVHVSVADGSIVNVEQKRPKADAPTDIVPAISVEEATRVALIAVPGTFIEAELGSRGRLVWEIYIRATSDNQLWKVHVNATTGAVIESRLDANGDGHNDDGSEDNHGGDDDGGDDHGGSNDD